MVQSTLCQSASEARLRGTGDFLQGDDVRFAIEYRRDLVRTLTRRALERAVA